MRKILLGTLLFAGVVLSGCSLSSFQDFVESKTSEIIKKDQAHEQKFVFTKAMLYDAFDVDNKRLDLSNAGLVALPDVCTLLDEEDYASVRRLDASNNNIRILNTDLSCLKFLKTLDLSRNNIQAVQTLGKLPALQELNMEHNALTTTQNFPDFPVLEKLYLAYNNIREVKDLDHLKNLVVLELQHNVVEYVIGVENMQQLKQLRMDYEAIQGGDLTPLLEKLENTELLDNLGNVLGDQVKAKLLEELPF